ncbi:MAG TPA: hypothetical protein VK066_09135 [Chloroflexota bacterium]|nr:hypothetical protein [Chloroflexota bacterium]
MVAARLRTDQVVKLADDVRAKIIARQSFISEAEGEITIRIFRSGDKFDIKVTATTR